jgi:hypothetical protein
LNNFYRKRNRTKLPFPTEDFSLPPREHKKVNYAEYETFSDSLSENNKKQNHGNYISWSSAEDALLIEQVQKYLEAQKTENNLKNQENDSIKINQNSEKNEKEYHKQENNMEEKKVEEPKEVIEEEKLKPSINVNWNKIAEKFENKNARQCQTRWQNILDPNRVKGPWTKEEDMKLMELVKKFGAEKWSNISSYLPGRLGKQCRERWFNHLNPEVRKTGWSKEEEWMLFLLHRKYGNSWSILSEKIPGRTDNTIKNHWNSIMKKNIVGINNQYQEMIKGKSKEEIEEIEKNIIEKCNKSMYKDYNEYYQEKAKSFPMLKNKKKNKEENENKKIINSKKKRSYEKIEKKKNELKENKRNNSSKKMKEEMKKSVEKIFEKEEDIKKEKSNKKRKNSLKIEETKKKEKKIKKRTKRIKMNEIKKAKFNVSKQGNNNTPNNNIKINPLNNDIFQNNNNYPYQLFPFENKCNNIFDEEKDYTKINRILISDSKEKYKKEQFPFKVPPNFPFYRSDIKNSSESSGGNNSLGKITPDYRMNPSFMASNNKYYLFSNPQNYPQNRNFYFNSNPKIVRFVGGENINNNNNKISTDSNSIHSFSMNQSMLSANSAFKKSNSGSGSGSGRSFQPRNGVLPFQNMADLNKEYFSNISIDEKNANNKS